MTQVDSNQKSNEHLNRYTKRLFMKPNISHDKSHGEAKHRESKVYIKIMNIIYNKPIYKIILYRKHSKHFH